MPEIDCVGSKEIRVPTQCTLAVWSMRPLDWFSMLFVSEWIDLFTNNNNNNNNNNNLIIIVIIIIIIMSLFVQHSTYPMFKHKFWK